MQFFRIAARLPNDSPNFVQSRNCLSANFQKHSIIKKPRLDCQAMGFPIMQDLWEVSLNTEYAINLNSGQNVRPLYTDDSWVLNILAFSPT
jgi:hypothetical protein